MRTIELHPRILFYFLGLVALLWLGAQLTEVLVILLVAFIINAAFRPTVDFLERKRVPRFLGIVLMFVLVFGVIGLVLAVIAGELLAQLGNLINSLPQIYGRLAEFASVNLPFLDGVFKFGSLQSDIEELVKKLNETDFIRNMFIDQGIPAVQRVLGFLGRSFSLLLSIFTTVMISVYMLLRRDKVQSGLIGLLPKGKQKFVNDVLEKVETSLGAWVVGQLILMVLVGLATYVVLIVPSLFFPGYALAEFALPIALIAGLLEALPNLGPLVAMVIAAIIALGSGGLGAVIYVVAMFLLIQNLEAVLLVPQVMKKSVGLDPIVTILAIIGAFKIGGVLAALLAVPVAAAAQIILQAVLAEKRESAGK
ncbi:MAG: AI-2E family transporter [Candidatus Doudnabacteria bacterium]|nr:AI-2E family transporter [Candidatus Doudnabacteria bacterium]